MFVLTGLDQPQVQRHAQARADLVQFGVRGDKRVVFLFLVGGFDQ